VSFISDGTLYLINGTTAYPIVPDSIADNDLAALTVGPQIDALLPRALWTQTPTIDSPAAGEPASVAVAADTVAPQPAAAPARAVPSPSAPAVPAPLARVACPGSVQTSPLVAPDAVPITGTADLTGKAHHQIASDPVLLIALGATITSAVGGPPDPLSSSADVFAIGLSCGTKYRFTFSSTNAYGHGALLMRIEDPYRAPAGTVEVHWQLTADARQHVGDCWVIAGRDSNSNVFTNYDCTFTPTTVGGIYLLGTDANFARDYPHPADEPQNYTFQVTPL
jgi:hypothetical protein